jgi:hypothetical protein
MAADVVAPSSSSYDDAKSNLSIIDDMDTMLRSMDQDISLRKFHFANPKECRTSLR